MIGPLCLLPYLEYLPLFYSSRCLPYRPTSLAPVPTLIFSFHCHLTLCCSFTSCHCNTLIAASPTQKCTCHEAKRGDSPQAVDLGCCYRWLRGQNPLEVHQHKAHCTGAVECQAPFNIWTFCFRYQNSLVRFCQYPCLNYLMYVNEFKAGSLPVLDSICICRML